MTVPHLFFGPTKIFSLPSYSFVLIFFLISFISSNIFIRHATADTLTDVRAGVKAKELKKLQDRIKQLRKSLKAAHGKKDQTRNELRKAEKNIASLSLKLRTVKKELGKLGKRLKKLESKQRSFKKTLASHRNILSKHVRASYIMGHQEQIKMLLNQRDPSRVQRTVAYYDYLNRSRAQQIQTVIGQLEQLQQIETAIALEKEKQENFFSKRKQERKLLEKGRRQRTLLLAKLSKEIQHKDKRLKTMLNDEKELKELLHALEEALSDIPPDNENQQSFLSLKGMLPWPSKGKISKHFGKRRNVGDLRWNGVVIKAPMGRNVHAISHGRVAFADWLRGYGMIIIIDHGNGYMSLYGWNQHLLKETGEWVEAGEVIAGIGDSGGQAKSGLYFELRHQGKPVNPMYWCKKIKGNLVGMNYR